MIIIRYFIITLFILISYLYFQITITIKVKTILYIVLTHIHVYIHIYKERKTEDILSVFGIYFRKFTVNIDQIYNVNREIDFID